MLDGNALLLGLCLLMPYCFNLTVIPLVLLAASSFWRARRELGRLLRERSDWPLYLLLGWTLVISPFTLDASRHLYGWLVQSAGFVGLYLLIRLRICRFGLDLDKLLGSLLLGAAGICILGWVQFANFGFVIRSLPLPPSDGLWSFYLIDLIMIPIQHAHYRVYSLFYAPPMLGVYLSLLLPIAVYKLQQARAERFRLLWALVLFLLLSNLLLSYTRIAWLAAAISLPILLLHATKGKGLVKVGVGALSGLGALIGISLALPSIGVMARERALTIFSLEHYSNAGRLQIWQRSWDAFLSHWFSGNGILCFWRAVPEYLWLWPHTHSLLLQQLFETGVIGALLWYLWLGARLRGLGSDQLGWAIGCAVLAWLICGWADYPGYEPRNQFVFWALLALGNSLAPVRPNEPETA